MSEKTKSFASIKNDYTVVQGRMKDGKLHIQGRGDNVNRDYGVAVDFPIMSDLADWLDNDVDHYEKSLAGTEAMYFPLQYALRGDNVHFQVAGESNFNRAYGAMFNVSVDDVPQLVDFAA